MKLSFIVEYKNGISKNCMKRNLKKCSTVLFGNEKLYQCRDLSTWFRLGNYAIKHDYANWLLDITRGASWNDNERDSILWWNADKQEYENCLDHLARCLDLAFNGHSHLYIKLLLEMQEELKGYENVFYRSKMIDRRFDYEEFMKDKDAYAEKLEKIF